MSRDEKKVVIIIAFVLVVCFIAGCTTTNVTNQTPNVSTQHNGNVQKAVMSITTTNTAPAVNQAFTVHGSLQDDVSGAPLAGQPFKFYIIYANQVIEATWGTTDANGAYSFTRSESEQGTYWFEVAFYGNSQYSKAGEMVWLTVGNPIPTEIRSLAVTNNNPAVSQPFTFSGYLTDINGNPLSDKTVWVYTRLPNGEWDMDAGSPHTDSNGYFSITYSKPTTGLYRFEFHFYGDNTYAHCGPAVEVAVGTLIPSSLTITPSTTIPAVNEPFTLWGGLTDANGAPIAGQQIFLGRIIDGQPTTPGDGGAYDHTWTDQNGRFSFVLTESISGSYQYTAAFMGDETHASAPYAWVRIVVGTLTPTTLTVTASTTTPTVNQHFTLSGKLTANGAPLTGKTIRLQREDPSGQWEQAVATIPTDANGAYSFTLNEPVKGNYRFVPTFDGDSYALAQALISIAVT